MHFEKAGRDNTLQALKMAFDYAQVQGIRHIVVASTYGYTAQLLLDLVDPSINVVVVTHNTGFKEPGLQEFPDDIRQQVAARGVRVLTGTMVLRSLGTAIRDMGGGYSEQELVANALRMFCQGIKVCAEITAMAADAGLIPPEDIIAVAGTGRGADTVCLIKADSSNRFFKIKVKEIITKPKEF
ncbi:MAG TPA: hypothetical protein DCR97_05290 [Deltaproteobacteria bacterium]|nr:hypothetical protein [Deltaproteobacteria bacterium]